MNHLKRNKRQRRGSVYIQAFCVVFFMGVILRGNMQVLIVILFTKSMYAATSFVNTKASGAVFRFAIFNLSGANLHFIKRIVIEV